MGAVATHSVLPALKHSAASISIRCPSRGLAPARPACCRAVSAGCGNACSQAPVQTCVHRQVLDKDLQSVPPWSARPLRRGRRRPPRRPGRRTPWKPGRSWPGWRLQRSARECTLRGQPACGWQGTGWLEMLGSRAAQRSGRSHCTPVSTWSRQHCSRLPGTNRQHHRVLCAVSAAAACLAPAGSTMHEHSTAAAQTWQACHTCACGGHTRGPPRAVTM